MSEPAPGKATTMFDRTAVDGAAPLAPGWIWTTLDQFAETAGGVTKGRNLEGRATVRRPYPWVANVQRGWLDLGSIKEIEAPVEEGEFFNKGGRIAAVRLFGTDLPPLLEELNRELTA